MESKLRNLYALQLVDSALDELEELKGDLPAQRQEIEERVSHMEESRNGLEREMRESFASREAADNEILELRDKLDRYKGQQLEVRNNREYDALTREMDHATDTIRKLEKQVEVLEGKAMTAKKDMESIDAQLEEVRKELTETTSALGKIAEANEEEELKYRHEREKLLTRIDKAHLRAYERIRKAKKGRAVVPLTRGACGGCFAKVTPQRILELRQNDRIYHCEHCGRIIVSDEIVEATSPAA